MQRDGRERGCPWGRCDRGDRSGDRGCERLRSASKRVWLRSAPRSRRSHAPSTPPHIALAMTADAAASVSAPGARPAATTPNSAAPNPTHPNASVLAAITPASNCGVPSGPRARIAATNANHAQHSQPTRVRPALRGSASIGCALSAIFGKQIPDDGIDTTVAPSLVRGGFRGLTPLGRSVRFAARAISGV